MRRRNNANAHHAGGANRGGQHRNRRYNNNRSNYNAVGDGQNDHANAARVRRHATAQREKYNNMARDALSSGDRVQAEYYFQHVEHFTRVLNELPPEETRQNRHYNGHRDQYGAPPDHDVPPPESAPQDAMPDESMPQPQARRPRGDYDRAENARPASRNGDDFTPQNEESRPQPAAASLPAFITGGGRRPAPQPAPRSGEE
jgi:hypothetical protein